MADRTQQNRTPGEEAQRASNPAFEMMHLAAARMQVQPLQAPDTAAATPTLVAIPDGSEKSQLGALVLTCASRPFGEPCFRLGEPHRHDLHRFDRWHRNSTG